MAGAPGALGGVGEKIARMWRRTKTQTTGGAFLPERDGHRRWKKCAWNCTGFGVSPITRGDGFAWLPKEKKVLFTGDACVNGPQQ